MFDVSMVMFWIFRWVNFLIIAGAASYFFHKKFLSIIRTKISEKRHFFQSLYEKLEAALHKNKMINKEVDLQQRNAALLLSKVEQWNHAVEAVRDKDKTTDKKRLKAMEQYRERQLAEFAVLQVRKRVIPEAVHKAQKELAQQFSQETTQVHYMNDIISFMKKS
ncbi:hypothetical protein HOM50_05070 [bacterium]|jgi:hypothetical protein|nr:hypothetical protein [bacterium]MBT5015753.1 hypothetical protein [bacterium]